MLNNTSSLHAIPINNLTKVIGPIVQPSKLTLERPFQRGNLHRAPVGTKGVKSSVGAIGAREGVVVLFPSSKQHR